MFQQLLEATRARILKHGDEVKELRAKELEAVEDCRIKKMDIGNNYWERRHHAEQRLHAAQMLAEILTDAAHTVQALAGEKPNA